jgi:hypothetical protein
VPEAAQASQRENKDGNTAEGGRKIIRIMGYFPGQSALMVKTKRITTKKK